MNSSTDDSNSKTGKKKKKKGKIGKVFPLNGAFKAGSDLINLITRKDSESDQPAKETAADVVSKAHLVLKGVDRFKDLRCGRRQVKTGTTGNQVSAVKKTNIVRGIDASISAEPLNPNVANAELIGYFGHLAASEDPNVVINLEYLELILSQGANINCTDKFGQTALHEVARTWEPDVATFLIAKGANVNQSDSYGRTPLHVAAAVDFPEMINVLLDRGADLEAQTDGENQSPLHYAARNDANNALQLLIKKGAKIHHRDYKGRTPLQVAAELDRSETAHMLLELGAHASDVDRTGLTALQLMVVKMPAVAKQALNQLYRYDRANRKQYYDHHLLEPLPNDASVEAPNRTVLQSIVHFNQLELIMHPVCSRLVEVKWERFGKKGAYKLLAFNLFFILMWTVLAVSLENPFEYAFPQDTWRLVLEICGVVLTLYQIIVEFKEYLDSKSRFMLWKKWRVSDIERDFKYCHPRWPQERQYLDQEIEYIMSQSPSYFSEGWNLFDWSVYISLLAVSILHVVDIFVDADGLSTATQDIFAIVIIVIWIRLLKSVRAFRSLGPFIVMLGLIAKDVAVFGFLYMNFYIPYACAFWMVYGNNNGTIPSLNSVDQMMFSLFRITLVDEYDYDGMRQVNVVMTYLLLFTFLVISAVLCINVLIAMLSNTFQRVYDNASAIAVMQQTRIVLSIEDGLNNRRKEKYANYIRSCCSPESLYYDDDMTQDEGEDVKKMTFRIKDHLTELDEYIRENQHVDQKNSIKALQNEITELKDTHQKSLKKVQNEMKVVQELLKAVLDHQGGGGGEGGGGNGPGASPSNLNQSSLLQTSQTNPADVMTMQQTLPTVVSPRFVGRRNTKTLSPLISLEDTVDGSSSARAPPYLTSPVPPADPSVDDKQRMKLYRKESKRQRKIRHQREEYLQQQLKKSQLTEETEEQESPRFAEDDDLPLLDLQETRHVDEEAPAENVADLVRMQSTVVFDTETKEDGADC